MRRWSLYSVDSLRKPQSFLNTFSILHTSKYCHYLWIFLVQCLCHCWADPCSTRQTRAALMIGDGPAFHLSFFCPPLDSTRQFLLLLSLCLLPSCIPSGCRLSSASLFPSCYPFRPTLIIILLPQTKFGFHYLLPTSWLQRNLPLSQKQSQPVLAILLLEILQNFLDFHTTKNFISMVTPELSHFSLAAYLWVLTDT